MLSLFERGGAACARAYAEAVREDGDEELAGVVGDDERAATHERERALTRGEGATRWLDELPSGVRRALEG